MTQASCSDFIRLKGTVPFIRCRWGMIPWATSRITAACTRLVWVPLAFASWVETSKWSRYRFRAFSSSRG